MKFDNVLGVKNLDASIYRIFSKRHFFKILTSQTNTLVNPPKWEDPFESFFLRANVRAPKGEQVSTSSIAADWYGQCWTFSEESDAMWRIYSPKPVLDAIKVRTTVRRLFQTFYDNTDIFASLKFFVGAVTYLTESEIVEFMQEISFWDIATGGQGTGFAKLLCIKREAFRHENEIRVLFQDLDPRRGHDGVAEFRLNANEVFDQVVIDPRLPEAQAAVLQKEIEDTGCTLPVTQSSLYRAPKFILRLE